MHVLPPRVQVAKIEQVYMEGDLVRCGWLGKEMCLLNLTLHWLFFSVSKHTNVYVPAEHVLILSKQLFVYQNFKLNSRV